MNQKQDFQMKAKIAEAAEKEYLGRQSMGIGGATSCSTEARESLHGKLLRRLRDANAQSEASNRAIAILEAHPEFEDFMWLMNSGLTW